MCHISKNHWKIENGKFYHYILSSISIIYIRKVLKTVFFVLLYFFYNICKKKYLSILWTRIQYGNFVPPVRRAVGTAILSLCTGCVHLAYSPAALQKRWWKILKYTLLYTKDKKTTERNLSYWWNSFPIIYSNSYFITLINKWLTIYFK